MAPRHRAINGYERVVLDHYKSPYSDGEREPDRDVVDNNAKVGVEPEIGRPAPRVLCRDVFRGQQFLMKEERQVFHDQGYIGYSHA